MLYSENICEQKEEAMALIHVSYLSKALNRTVPITVILPVDKISISTMEYEEQEPFKTLYLLHG